MRQSSIQIFGIKVQAVGFIFQGSGLGVQGFGFWIWSARLTINLGQVSIRVLFLVQTWHESPASTLCRHQLEIWLEGRGALTFCSN